MNSEPDPKPNSDKQASNDWGDGTLLPKITPPNWSHMTKAPGPCRNTPCDLTAYEDGGKTGEVVKEVPGK